MGKLDTGLSVARTVMSLRLAPLLLVVFAILWPLAGFPWWPLAFVVALGVVLRVLGFGYLIAGKRGPVLLVGLLVATTLLAWSPWAVATGVGLVIAGRGVFLWPRYHLLAAGLVLAVMAGAGWTVEVVTAAEQVEQYRSADAALLRAKLLPDDGRRTIAALLRFARDNDPSTGCYLFTDTAADQFAARWGARDCGAAFEAWHAQITDPLRYEVSPQLQGDGETTSPDRETITVDACGLRWESPITGSRPAGGPTDIGRMVLTRELGQGYRIAGFAPC